MAQKLSKLSLKELNALKRDVEKAIATYQKRAREKARAEMEKVAKAHGLEIGDIYEGAKPARKTRVSKPRGKVAPKYRNPEDASQTWTGRGRKPLWVVAALDSGKSLDDIAI